MPLLECSCPAGTYRGKCWHLAAVEVAILKGGTFSYPIEYRSRTDARRVYLIKPVGTGQEPA